MNELGAPLSYRLFLGQSCAGMTLAGSVATMKDQTGKKSVVVVTNSRLARSKNIVQPGV